MTCRLRVMSANLMNDGADAEAFGALVETVEPDLVAVQELGFAQAEVLARLLPFGKLEPARNHRGMGIALRRPGSVRYVRLRYRGLYVADVDGDGDAGSIEVLNVHIAAPHILPPHQSFARRRAQLAGLLDYLDGSEAERRVLVGDLNSTPVWPVYRRLARRFHDAALEVARRSERRPCATWGPGTNGRRRLFRIDHVLVSGLAAQDFRVLPIRGSDHSAVVADLAWPA
jgi:endonuclease/exonuclease/phosphatase family metal-dependent hydrolase